MTRKSKQPGGHNPLTYHERSQLTSYGTASARLGSESHIKFGDCCLGLVPAVDPVATPSGHIYSREAIVSYLLTKKQELQRQQNEYDALILKDERTIRSRQELRKAEEIRSFRRDHQGGAATRMSTEEHARDFTSSLSKKIDTGTTDNNNNSKNGRNDEVETSKQALKRTSYWLSESQPQYTSTEAKEEHLRNNPPPKRPPSPMSNRPLKLKDLIPIVLNREGGTSSGSTAGDGTNENNHGKCICAVSNKAITTQPVVLLKKTGVVILQDVYRNIVKPTKMCPVTGKKLKEKDVMVLTKGTSGFAASGKVVAKKYRPTLT